MGIKEYGLSLEERDLLMDILSTDSYKVLIKCLDRELNDLTNSLVRHKLEPNQEGVLRLALERAKYDGALLLVNRLKSLKQSIRD